MTAEIIDGKALSAEIREGIKEKVSGMKVKPGLAAVRIGDDPASTIYVNMKEKACNELGFYSEKHVLPEDTTEEDLLKLVGKLNKDKKIHGILVQLPLPGHIDEEKVLDAIASEKDVDGFSPHSMGLMLREKKFNSGLMLPATPKGVIRLIEKTGYDLNGKNAVVIGRSNIVGKPVAIMLLQKNATVTICHSRTKDLVEECKKADVIVAAIGRAEMITADFIKEGALVIDVGMNRVDDASKKKGYRLCGDVAYDEVSAKAGYITPVPGGVGPMTITMLLENTLIAAENKK